MYNEQLEKLIEMALMDGELTEKEKQILFKKAESFGVDLDEFEMVLEAKLLEIKKSAKVSQTAQAAPKSDNFRDWRKDVSSASMYQSFQIYVHIAGIALVLGIIVLIFVHWMFFVILMVLAVAVIYFVKNAA
jgi:hypothetical protein